MSRRPLFWIPFSALFFSSLLWLATRGVAQNEVAQTRTQPVASVVARPQYHLSAQIDYDLLTFKSQAQITIPVRAGDALRDAVFFLYANADGVGNSEPKHKNIVVDAVSFDGASVPFDLQAAVLRVKLPAEQRAAFDLKIDYHGIVPRSPSSSGGLMDMMGGMDLGALLGGATSEKKNADYGLYTYGNGILSLGSFWYPSLAVRQNGKWMDEAPEGLGDVGYSEMSDFDVSLDFDHMRGHPLTVAASGEGIPTARPGAPDAKLFDFRARNVRDFAVLMSEDYVVKSKSFDVGGKAVNVEAYTLKKDAAQSDKAIDIAGHALQIYAKRFGAYPYSNFKVVEGPIKGGAGGMEFSGMTSIASMLYGDLGKQLNDLAGSLGAGVGALGKTLQTGEEDGDADATTANPAADMLQGLLGGQKEILDSLFEATIAHEVGHQWWAIGVGSDSQRAPWVDESLTNYASMLYFEDRYGRARMEKMMDAHLRQTYSMGRMIGGGDAPVNLKTADYKNNVQYGAIVYGKGALFYDALRREVGDEVFFGSLRQYFGQYQGKLAGARTLRDIVIGRAPGKKGKIEALYARWIEQSHGDEDIAGGKVTGLEEMLGGLMGGVTDEQ